MTYRQPVTDDSLIPSLTHLYHSSISLTTHLYLYHSPIYITHSSISLIYITHSPISLTHLYHSSISISLSHLCHSLLIYITHLYLSLIYITHSLTHLCGMGRQHDIHLLPHQPTEDLLLPLLQLLSLRYTPQEVFEGARHRVVHHGQGAAAAALLVQ